MAYTKREEKEIYIFKMVLLNNGTINCDIDASDLVYSDFNSHHGMQCNFSGDCPESKRILELCKIATDAIKEIHKINYRL